MPTTPQRSPDPEPLVRYRTGGHLPRPQRAGRASHQAESRTVPRLAPASKSCCATPRRHLAALSSVAGRTPGRLPRPSRDAPPGRRSPGTGTSRRPRPKIQPCTVGPAPVSGSGRGGQDAVVRTRPAAPDPASRELSRQDIGR